MDSLTPQQLMQQRAYIGRVNKVIDYIMAHLDEDLCLNELAREACFSPFHFHRLFSALVGETLNGFIRRKRVEKAAALLLDKPAWPVSEIASFCGFSGNSAFSRAFKEDVGMSATAFRNGGYKQFSKNRKLHSKAGKSPLGEDGYIRIENVEQINQIAMNHIEIKEMPAMHAVYVRHTGQFDQIGKAYQRLMQWAGPRGLLKEGSKTATVYHDDPKVTEIEKLQQSACLIVDGPVEVSDEVGKLEIVASPCAVGRFEILPTGFTEAWDSMCRWMVQNGYEAANLPPYELYHADCHNHPEGKFVLDICIPVEKS
jgi:AraC family transcriptional regulator